MKLTAKIKLYPTEAQRQLLHETLQRGNAACNYISDVAWQEKVFNKLSLQKLCYYDVRDRFGLSAQMAVRALGKVADSYIRWISSPNATSTNTARFLMTIAF